MFGSGRLNDTAVANTPRTHVHSAGCLAVEHADTLEVGVPPALCQVVRVADSVAVHRTLATNLTSLCHISLLFRPVTLPRLPSGSTALSDGVSTRTRSSSVYQTRKVGSNSRAILHNATFRPHCTFSAKRLGTRTRSLS